MGTNWRGVRVEEATGDFPVSFTAGVVLSEAITVGELENVGGIVERVAFWIGVSGTANSFAR
jgi:hypothetical protein